MENDEDYQEVQDLPEPQPGNTIEESEEHYRTVNEIMDILDSKLKAACENQENPWASQVLAAKAKETGDEHIVGIIGATGSGKSALLNAILDEECLVPTSCMQACTAAVIEVAYNRSSHHDYRAIIEFVSRESWHAEMSILVKDTTSSAAEDFKDDTSEAAIALAKLSAVYPDINQKSLANICVDELIERPGLEILGTCLEIVAADGFELYTALRKYVESKEKSCALFGSKQNTSHRNSHDIEYWPLIRKVRIFTKAAVLKTGVVLVDLPGVADVNAARGSIAREYLPNCASLWIVVPIIRAVDDQVGRYLLGEQFKRQLRRDGALNRVAFICSKSDLGFVRELKGKFASDEIFQAQIEKIDADRKRFATHKTEVTSIINKMKRSIRTTSDQIIFLQSEHDTYTKLLEMAKRGRLVYPPILRGTKRAITATRAPARKRLILETLLSSLDSQSQSQSQSVRDGGDMTDTESSDIGEQHISSTNDIEQDTSQPAMKTTDLQNKSDTILRSIHELQKKRDNCEKDMAQQKARLEEIVSLFAEQEWDACVRARNRYVSKHLKSDFKLGIRDLERADAEEEVDFDPQAELVESTEQQMDLPVFCTASQSFQQLRRRFEDETISGRLTNLDQTGIPELMRYCIDIGAKEIVATRAVYTNAVSQLLTSVRFWLSRNDDVSVVQPAGTQSIQELTDKLAKVWTSFQSLRNIANNSRSLRRSSQRRLRRSSRTCST